MGTWCCRKGRKNSLITPRSRYFLPFVIYHRLIPPLVIRPSKRNNLILIVPLFTHQAIDLIIQITDLIVGQSGCEASATLLFSIVLRWGARLTVLDFGNFSTDVPQYITSPPLTFPQRRHTARHARSTLALHPVPHAHFYGLGLAESIQHRLRLFGVSRHDEAG